MKSSIRILTTHKTINWLISCAIVTCFIMVVNSTAHSASVQLQWDPNTEPDLAGYKIYYKADSSSMPFDSVGAVEGVSPVDVRNVTSTIITGLDPNHSYNFAVTAYNSAGVESSYSNIVAIPELAAPVVDILSPSNSSDVTGTVSVTATASDNVGVTKVEFYLNGILVGSDTSAPYLYSWNTATAAPGSYAITVKAYDAAGNVGNSGTVSVNVVNDVSAPTVSFAYPSNNETVNGTVDVTANASDNVAVSMVEFYENGVLVAAVNSSPFKYTWNTSNETNGQFALLVKAYDAKGNVGQAGISVTVSNGTGASGSPIYTIADATLALQVAVGKVKPTNEQKSRLDLAPFVNGKSSPNGKIDAADAILILAKVVGKTTY